MSEHERLMRIEHKLDAVLFRTKLIIYHLLSKRELEDMSKLHDDLRTLVQQNSAAADQLIAAKTETETSLQDVMTELEANTAKMRAAAQDDASQGSSTGAGSGAATGTTTGEVGA